MTLPVRASSGEHTLEDEDPSPSLVPVDAVHEIDDSSEQPTERTSRSSGREEEGDSEVDLVASVPLGQVEGDTGEQTCPNSAPCLDYEHWLTYQLQ